MRHRPAFFVSLYATFSCVCTFFGFFLVKTSRRIGGPAATIVRDERGASAVEFGLVAPVLMTMLLGTVEFANIYFVQSEMTAVARDATRRVALDAMTRTQVKSFVEERIARVTGGTPTVSVTSTKLANERTDITVDVSVPISEVTFFGFESLIDDGSSSESSSAGPADSDAASSSSTRGDDDTGSPNASRSGCLSASATMIKE